MSDDRMILEDGAPDIITQLSSKIQELEALANEASSLHSIAIAWGSQGAEAAGHLSSAKQKLSDAAEKLRSLKKETERRFEKMGIDFDVPDNRWEAGVESAKQYYSTLFGDIGSHAKDTASGLFNMVNFTDWETFTDTWHGTFDAVTHPRSTLKQMWNDTVDPITTAWERGRVGEAGGHAVAAPINFLLDLVGAKGAGKIAKLPRRGKGRGDDEQREKDDQKHEDGTSIGTIDESAKEFSPKERSTAELLAREGKHVTSRAEGTTRSADAMVDGVRTEFKNLDEGATHSTVKNRISESIRGTGQARHIIIDARGSGLTEAEAMRGLGRAKNITRGKIDSVRIIGDGFDKTSTDFL